MELSNNIQRDVTADAAKQSKWAHHHKAPRHIKHASLTESFWLRTMWCLILTDYNQGTIVMVLNRARVLFNTVH